MDADSAGTAGRPGVDWELAAATATRLVRPGPDVTPADARAVVAELRADADRARDYVAEVTGLDAGSSPVQAPVLVVDRPGWIRANVDAFAQVLDPVSQQLAETGWASGVAARASGVEVGVLMSYLAPKVLGQYDPYADPAGRLLLVAPNVVHVERELRVPASDFRLWVCLHEETHRVQFTAVPWLRDHLRGLIARVVGATDLSAEAITELLRTAVARATGRAPVDQGGLSLLDLMQTAEQKAVVDEITAVMTLLEGHADMMMDQVGPDVIPSVVQIRAKFNHRRKGQGPDRLIRRLLGLEAKMRQYRLGSQFCRTVIDQVGLDGFNQVWSGPEALPTQAEIDQPQQWIDRVVGATSSTGSEQH